jgi:peptidyl-prolyl cis-trans isomerase-like 1
MRWTSQQLQCASLRVALRMSFISAIAFASVVCAVQCVRREQPERLARFQNIAPNIPQSEQSTKRVDTIPIATHRVYMVTSKGALTLELYGNDAPKTVENFVTLAKRRVYDNTLIHRIAKDFVIQGGDPKTKDKRKKDEWGLGGESAFGEPFDDELHADAPSFVRGYKRGTLASANRGPGTNTSQFFICLRDIPELPKQHTIFGCVTEGMDVVDAIAAEAVQPVLNESDGRPLKPIVVKSVRVVMLRRR